MAAAIRTLRMEAILPNDTLAAVRLIVKYGDEEQFADYLEALAQARTTNDRRYNNMWWIVESEKGPRIVRILCSVLFDERPSQRLYMDQGMRYCDAAGLRLQQVVGVNFGFRHVGRQNAAVARARKWIAANRTL